MAEDRFVSDVNGRHVRVGDPVYIALGDYLRIADVTEIDDEEGVVKVKVYRNSMELYKLSDEIVRQGYVGR